MRCFLQWSLLVLFALNVRLYTMFSSFVQVKSPSAVVLIGFDGSLELLYRWQFDDILGELIPVFECPWKEAVFVCIRGGA